MVVSSRAVPSQSYVDGPAAQVLMLAKLIEGLAAVPATGECAAVPSAGVPPIADVNFAAPGLHQRHLVRSLGEHGADHPSLAMIVAVQQPATHARYFSGFALFIEKSRDQQPPTVRSGG